MKTARDVADFLLDLAKAESDSLNALGVDEERRVRVRRVIERLSDKEAVATLEYQRARSVILAAHEVAMLHIENAERKEAASEAITVVDDDPTAPCATLPIDPRGSRR